jgi:hypothetical protein
LAVKCEPLPETDGEMAWPFLKEPLLRRPIRGMEGMKGVEDPSVGEREWEGR